MLKMFFLFNGIIAGFLFFFDYFDVEKNSGDEYLYCLFPKIIERERIILRFPRNLFVAFVSDFSNVQTYLINAFRKILNVEQEKILSIQRQKQTVGVHGFSIDLVARRQYKQRQMQEAIAKANARNNGYSNWGKKSKSCHSSNFRYRK
ncbi:MAG: hypothetical protein MJ048_06165 [Acidaminococcaceae bacterium]|nr:hypothetical protein [Acidaminococcaceae bacterium]